MEISTEYNFGDQVWTLHRSSETLELPCRFCRGRQSLPVEGPGGETKWADCPECKGMPSMARIAVVPTWVASEKPLTIRQVRIELTEGVDCRDMPERDEGYMCEETGVGSGTVHRPENLFHSQAEAKEEAERRTEIREGWKPSDNEIRAAQGFLDHRDVYEYTEEHIEVAEQIVAAAEKVAS